MLLSGQEKREKEQVEIIVGESGVERKGRQRRPKRKARDLTWSYIGRFGELGFIIAVPIAGGAVLGNFIDNRFSTHPRATLAFLFLGLIIVISQLYKFILDEWKNS